MSQPIAFCITELDRGGAERALVELVRRLPRDKWAAHVFCLGPPGELVEPLQQAGIPVECFGGRGLRDAPRVLLRLRRRLRQIRPVVLQTFLFHANVLGTIAGKWAGVPHIVTGIRVAERRYARYLRWERRAARWADAHVCVSESVAEFARTVGGLDPKKLVVIPNGIDLTAIDAAPPADFAAAGILSRASAAPQVVLFVGRLDEQKDPFCLLHAAPQILDDTESDRHIVFVGDGPLREPLQQAVANDERLHGRVHFAGRRDDVPGLMKSASCLVLCSRWEGMPNVVLEAMACRLPVVASDVEGVRELIPSAEFGRIVPPADPSSVASAVCELLENPAAAKHITAAARKRIAAELTIENTADRYCELYYLTAGSGSDLH